MVEYRLAHDARLTLRARGLMLWLLAHPDEWQYDAEAVVASVPEGRDAVRTALRELEAHGYIRRSRHRDAAGRWIHHFAICEIPGTGDGKPADGLPGDGEPVPDGEPADGLPGDGLPGDKYLEPVPIYEPSTGGEDELVTESAALCGLMADAIQAWGAKRPTVTATWERDMDRLLRIDGRTLEQVTKVLRWLFGSSDEVAVFWAPNVQSPAKLRARWDTIAGQVRAKRQSGTRIEDAIRKVGDL